MIYPSHLHRGGPSLAGEPQSGTGHTGARMKSALL